MKKLLFSLIMVLMLLSCLVVVKADEIGDIEVNTEIIPLAEEVHEEPTEVVENEPTEVVEEVEEVEEPTLIEDGEELKEDIEGKLKVWLDEKFENANLTTWVLTIFNAITSSSFLIALLGVVVKYSKYKNKNTDAIIDEVKNQVGEYLKERFDNLSEVEIKKLVKALDDLSQSNEVLMKVLILSQDKTTEGRVALLDYLGSKTENKEIKDQAQDQKEKLEEEIKENTTALEKVKNDYKDVF